MSEQPPSTPPTHLPPVSHPFPGSLTPGWNDPPSVHYNPETAGSGGRTKLNKRVPFPLQTNFTATTTKPTAIVQPCQNMTISSNIAVVHPMQYSNNGIPPTATLPAPTIGGQSAFIRESPSPVPPPTSYNIPGTTTVPTMSVPATPRGENSTGAFASTSVHHI